MILNHLSAYKLNYSFHSVWKVVMNRRTQMSETGLVLTNRIKADLDIRDHQLFLLPRVLCSESWVLTTIWAPLIHRTSNVYWFTSCPCIDLDGLGLPSFHLCWGRCSWKCRTIPISNPTIETTTVHLGGRWFVLLLCYTLQRIPNSLRHYSLPLLIEVQSSDINYIHGYVAYNTYRLSPWKVHLYLPCPTKRLDLYRHNEG